ncbi:UvrD-helicase domain-containing protein [Aquitalea sp.]|uniref:UvrD-helicase domain-containing protein n=1 Tax=Aquitalea sp. TaxID=1872623 RepID=UPI00258848A3|nr:UvrD-helicase domain-containing protein [Aquitalea sp.]
MQTTFNDNLLFALISLQYPQKLRLDSPFLQCQRLFGEPEKFSITQIHRLEVVAHSSWPLRWVKAYRLEIDVQLNKEQRITYLTLNGSKAQLEAIGEVIGAAFQLLGQRALESLKKTIDTVLKSGRELFQEGCYCRGSTMAAWQALHKATWPKQANLIIERLQSNALFKDQDLVWALKIQTEAARDLVFTELPAELKAHNKAFIDEAIKTYGPVLFSKLEQGLSDEQMRAALIFDDANVSIAAAGSGKTSVMVGKIGYALMSRLFNDNEILALAYNRKAADELQERIDEQLGEVLGRRVRVKADTFHAVGKAIYQASLPEGIRPEVIPLDAKRQADGEEDDQPGRRLFRKALDGLIAADSTFVELLVEWVAYYRHPEPVMEAFGEAEVAENEARYEKVCKKAIRAKVAKNKSWAPSIPTLNPALSVRSGEEAKIANWLYLHDVPFRYEPEFRKDWPELMDMPLTSTGGRRPYLPDFVYTSTEHSYPIFHEHFGQDKNRKAPTWMGGEKYDRRADFKRGVFEEKYGWLRRQSKLMPFLETSSAQFHDGTIFEHLENALTKRKVPVQPVTAEKRQKVLAQFRESNELEDLLLKFVSLFRDSGLSFAELEEKAGDEPHRVRLFLKLIQPLVQAVEQTYQDAGAIDFPDMINKAVHILRTTPESVPFNYKFILVDEFQDIAKLRSDLVQALLDRFPVESILFCVGDDWQAINRFAGADIRTFLSYIPDEMRKRDGAVSHRSDLPVKPTRSTHVKKLSKTFRCAQGIADVSKQLVLRNLAQIDKEVCAEIYKRIEGAVRVVGHDDSGDARTAALVSELERIASLPSLIDKDGQARPTGVFILTRNRKETMRPDGCDSKTLKALAERFTPLLHIEHETMHGSKGLGRDFVIIVGMESGYKGFPGEFLPDPLFEMLLPALENTLEEERRLLYVALTRAKQQVVLLTVKSRPSEFIVELEGMDHLSTRFEWVGMDGPRELCSCCKRGWVVLNKWGKRGCTRYPYCGYQRIETNVLPVQTDQCNVEH